MYKLIIVAVSYIRSITYVILCNYIMLERCDASVVKRLYNHSRYHILYIMIYSMSKFGPVRYGIGSLMIDTISI
jgi:hypothetical protein